MFFNLQGKRINNNEYDFAGHFLDGLSEVSLNGKWGFVDTLGKEIIPVIHDKNFFYSKFPSLIKAKKNNKVGYYDLKGKLVIPFNYGLYSKDFSEGLASVENSDGLYGYINEKGETIIPFKYSSGEKFEQGRAIVYDTEADYNKVIDKTGKHITNVKYEEIRKIYDWGMLAVKVNGKWGFIDRQGKLLIVPKFDSVDDFFQGKAEVEIGGKKIFISKWGNILKGCQSN